MWIPLLTIASHINRAETTNDLPLCRDHLRDMNWFLSLRNCSWYGVGVKFSMELQNSMGSVGIPSCILLTCRLSIDSRVRVMYCAPLAMGHCLQTSASS